LNVPSPLFRPNPDRSVIIDGKFDEQLVSRLTPTILKLQKTRQPITVYIANSPGGVIANMESLLRLLRSPDQNFSGPCRIITVVTRRAASAAADLLCSGDYAIAYPDSIIHYHGGRLYEETALTKERTTLLAEMLRFTTDYYAWDLARKIEGRFRLLFLISRGQFAEVRAKNHATMSDFECFLDIIMSKLTDKGKKVCEAARDRYKRYETLLNKIPRTKKSKKRIALLEAEQIKVILDFELEVNKKKADWTFRYGGLSRVTEDFHLLTEYLEGRQNERLGHWCSDFAKFAISSAEKSSIDAIPDQEKRNKKIIKLVQPVIEPVWSFFIALCHALQEGENELTAKDAYWLGLIDEVLGEQDMFARRLIAEYEPDPPPAPPPEMQAQTQVQGSGQKQSQETKNDEEKSKAEKEKSDAKGATP
jgi:ATP-dependent protease ClpP protease subunit